ncbi:hypothetical protein BDV33DRAFT_227851 [Aspergillus novoparasiticus]|uniref:Isopenicillin N synthase-like Fe(2+) 2OG dioxygenase domain-containing protein n=1 Tax=Aspergillus novoparasiticus TaxID=986946 RepID=A0A5N6EDE6_9EURO|nr:hypothetical protein BDV33DRAFT_227851 [Aspergillus novoparasiticus]
MSERVVPVISLKERTEEITQQLVEAAETAGFFDLPPEVKRKTPHNNITNNSWEYKAQLRPSAGMYDQKESLWLQSRSEWPSDQDVPGFRETTTNFMGKCAAISNRLLTCFAVALGFPSDYFCNANHVTLLFQRDDEDGLEICPGRESPTSFAKGDVFSPLPAKTGQIVVNIGDILMAWSDDRLKSTFQRVRATDVGKSPSRFSIAYFNQGRKNFIRQGPLKK